MWVYHVIIILSLLWQDTTCQELAGYTIQLKGDVTVQEGLCVTIPCTFTTAHGRTFTHSTGYWKISEKEIVASNNKSAKVVKPNFHLTGNTDTGDCSLTIAAARREDSGIYYFRFEETPDSPHNYNYKNSKASEISVTVTDYLTITITVEITGKKGQKSETVKVLEGDSLTLICSVDSNLAADITWMKGGENVPSSNTRQRQELRLSDIRTSDAATYYCLAENKYRRLSKSVNVTVQYPPRTPDVTISSSKGGQREENQSVITNEDGGLTLNCSVDSNPPSVMTWKKGEDINNVIGEGFMWSLVKIASSEAGTFRCSARNKHGSNNDTCIQIIRKPDPPSITITGEVKGQRIQIIESVKVLEGDSLRLICTADSNPAAHVTWMKGGENVTSNVIGQGLELSLTNITANDTAAYYCVACNEHGRVNKSVDVTVQYWRRKPNYISSTSTDTTSPILYITIGLICGIAIVLAALLLSKLFAKKQKPQNDPKVEPVTDDPRQLYMNVKNIPERSEEINATSTQVESKNQTAVQEELHYSTINFPAAPSRISSSLTDTDYAVIKLK